MSGYLWDFQLKMLHGTMLRYRFPDRPTDEAWGHRNPLNLTLQQYAEGEVERKKHMFKKAEEEDKHIFILSYRFLWHHL